MIEHLIYPATLLPQPNSLSVLSYNILLPNSQDGWWNYKMYNPPLTDENRHFSEWNSRSAMLRDRMNIIQADVVCLQEVAPDSFDSDFEFMQELGYDHCEMFKKGRFRPATFWKSSRVKLVTEPVHKDRTLLTTFNLVDTTDNTKDQNWHVLNCHLQAGKQGSRRVRQIFEGLSSVTKLAKKLKEPDPTNPFLIICGDFNGGAECGAVRFLEDGMIGPDFIEDGEQVVKSKEKRVTTSKPLVDVSSLISDKREPPATLVVPELISLMVEPTPGGDSASAYENPVLSTIIRDRLKRIYKRFASNENIMAKADVERWLIKINGTLGRGSEFRAAAREMGYIPPPQPQQPDTLSDDKQGEKTTLSSISRPKAELPQDGVLTEESFIQIYQEELMAGKFWGIAHDLAILGEELPNVGTFKARFDRMYCSDALKPTSVLDTVCDFPCPNTVEPSDHLPIAASFRAS